MNYNSVISAVRKYISGHKVSNTCQTNKMYQPPVNLIMNNKKGASAIYRVMLEPHKEVKGHTRQSNSVQITLDQWQNCFKTLKSISRDTKLRWFQLRIMHHILTTNRSVSKYNKEQSHLCQFCSAHSETIHHLFWKCDEVRTFWNQLEHRLNSRCNEAYTFKIAENVIIFGAIEDLRDDQSIMFQFIILLAKYYIYRCKVQGLKLSCRIFVNELYNRYRIEKHIQEDSTDFDKTWMPYLNIFMGLV